jgi:hypothetical protein
MTRRLLIEARSNESCIFLEPFKLYISRLEEKNDVFLVS